MEFEVLKQRSKNLAYEVTEIRRCEEEPIAFCGAIQPGGLLLVAEAESMIIRALSQNWETYFPGTKASEVLGQPLSDVVNFGVEKLTPRQICQRIETGLGQFSLVAGAQDVLVATACHTRNKNVFVEFEKKQAQRDESPTSAIKDLVHFLKASETIAEASEQTALAIKRLSGFDRVMIYRFDQEWNGEVIAEARADQLEPWLHLRYPHTDIPPQARDLFFRNQSRMIVDVNAEAVPIITRGFHPGELDLSLSILRAVSPIHLQYLDNMGVSASFSAPIRVNDKLWGLIACHHYSGPMHASQDIRSALELAAQITSGKISDLVARRRLQIKNETLLFTQKLLGEVASGKDAVSSFEESARGLLALTESSGAFIAIGGQEILIGDAPSRKSVDQIRARLKSIHALSAWSSNSLIGDVEGFNDPKAAGALAVPFSLGFEDCLIWFRPEELQEVRWGGKPKDKENPHMNTIERLTPRSSFAEWTERLENHSRPWSDADEECAQYFLFGFVQGIFSKAQALSSAYQELERVAKAKDEFIGTISHELRTPLGIIVGWIDILKEYPQMNNEATEAIEIIDRNAKLQITLINDLLDVSRIISGKLRLNAKPRVDIGRLVGDVVDGLRPTAAAKSIKLVWAAPAQFELTGDPDRLRQMTWNLITNALKFTGKGGEVKIEVEPHKSECLVRVKDNGIGIDPSQLALIFERFAQAKISSAHLGGLGLGLSIVKTLSELHGGRVQAFSEGEGKGSTFTITLPVYALQQNHDEPTLPTAATPSRTIRLQGIHILLAEDQPDSLRALKILVERNGGTAVGCSDGEQAYKALKAESFDLILSDVGMPGMNGHELIRAWRADEKRFSIKQVPAIALTAYASAKDRTLALEAGFQSHIAKPVDRDELLAVIDSLGLRKD